MSQNERVPYAQARDVAEKFSASLLSHGIDAFQICGSLRRGRPTIGDVDVTMTTEAFEAAQKIIPLITDNGERTVGTKAKPSKIKAAYLDGMKIEFYVGPAEGFGALTLFATGSPKFNIRCRYIATSMGWKLNQYGLWNVANNQMVCDCSNEASIIEVLRLGETVLEPMKREEG